MQERTDAAIKLAPKTLISNVALFSRQEKFDQKSFAEQRYDGETSLGNFTDNPKVELH